MALNISVFDGLKLRQGAMPPAPSLPEISSKNVASGAQSLVIPAGALVCVNAGEDARISWQATAGYNAPAADALLLKAGAERWFEMPKGGYLNYLAI